jgi:hypothetical protein
MSANAYIFECSTATYLDCVQKGLFGSNLPWPLQIKKGDHCCLYHYEVGTLFALWQAESDGGKNLIARAWGGRFPYQVRVTLLTPDIISLPKANVGEAFLNPETGKFHNRFEGDTAEALLRIIQ